MTSNRKDVRIRRTTADRLLASLQERILFVNSDDCRLAYKVNRAVVFGSYVNSDCETLGDLDIGFCLKERYDDIMEQKRAEQESMDRYRGRDWLMCLDNPREEVLKYLRNRSSYISLHDIDSRDREVIFSKDVMELEI